MRCPTGPKWFVCCSVVRRRTSCPLYAAMRLIWRPSIMIAFCPSSFFLDRRKISAPQSLAHAERIYGAKSGQLKGEHLRAAMVLWLILNDDDSQTDVLWLRALLQTLLQSHSPSRVGVAFIKTSCYLLVHLRKLPYKSLDEGSFGEGERCEWC